MLVCHWPSLFAGWSPSVSSFVSFIVRLLPLHPCSLSARQLDLLPFLYRSCDALSHPTSQAAHLRPHASPGPPSTSFHFVRAERSHVWSPDTLAQLSALQEYAVSKSSGRSESSSGDHDGAHLGTRNGRGAEGWGEGSVIQTHFLRNAGHWLHMDNPTGLVSLMAQHMGSVMRS